MRRVIVAALLASTLACTTSSPAPAPSGGGVGGGTSGTTAAPAGPPKPDVDPAALCQLKAEIDDAASRLKLAELRAQFEKESATDRAARFGAMLTIQNDQDRFHAFHDDGEKFPKSAVGPLGECFVYAAWKMADQATGRCEMADDRLRGAAIVDVARAELFRRKGALDQAQALVDNALSVDNGCAAALIEAARVAQAKNDNAAALASWERARAAWPKCYLCTVEAAKLTELTSTRDAAVPLWEAALVLQPDASEALKRYAAALAGVDPKRALDAYERAIAAGQNDVTTYMGAAQLAAQLAPLAGNDGAQGQLAAAGVDKALGLAERAAAAQPNEIDAWRLILQLAQRKKDAAKALKASQEILRLVEEDLPALLVLARDARANGNLVEAVVRYDAAARAIAGGRTGGVVDGELEAAKREHAKLLSELKVVVDKPAKGSPNAVIGSVQKTVQGVFTERLKKKKSLKGMIEVAVSVSEGGVVDDVEIVKDTLGDTYVAASVVANLKRANVAGGPKRYSFSMEFQ